MSIASGISGIELGLSAIIPNYKTVIYIEREINAVQILIKRMEDGSIEHKAPIYSDIEEFDPEPFIGKIHTITSGLPCQPFAYSGLRKQDKDPRYLFPAFRRIIEQVRSPVIFMEQVPGETFHYYAKVRPELSKLGYTFKEGLFSSYEIGAPQIRQRFFVLGCTDRDFLPNNFNIPVPEKENSFIPNGHGIRTPPPNAGQNSTEQIINSNHKKNRLQIFPPGPTESEEWSQMPTEMQASIPYICRETSGVSAGMVGRISAIGNSVSPPVSALAFRTLSEQLKRT